MSELDAYGIAVRVLMLIPVHHRTCMWASELDHGVMEEGPVLWITFFKSCGQPSASLTWAEIKPMGENANLAEAAWCFGKCSAVNVSVPDITVYLQRCCGLHALMGQSGFGGTKGTYTVLGRWIYCGWSVDVYKGVWLSSPWDLAYKWACI